MLTPIGKCRKCKAQRKVDFVTAPNHNYAGDKGFSVMVIAVCSQCGESVDFGYAHLSFVAKGQPCPYCRGKGYRVDTESYGDTQEVSDVGPCRYCNETGVQQ